MEDILIGTTDRTITVFIPDPASTDGSGKTGLTHADLTVSYTRVETDNDVVVTDVTSSLTTLTALTDAHADWGVKEVSSTLAPGLYRLDVADAVYASGAWYAVVYVMITTSAAAAVPKAFKLVAYNPLDGVRLGLTALPNAAADAAGGLPISDAGGLDLDNRMPSATSVGNMNVVFATDFANNYDTTNDRWTVGVEAINNDVITAASIANGAIDAATFAADVDAEILSYIVDDATKIDASDLNSKIDSLTFTVAGDVDVNVQTWGGTAISTPPAVNATQISGDGTAADTLELFAEALDQVTGQIDSGSFAAGAIAAATFAADVDAEILSYLVDDATRIDASALNTASVTTIPGINTKIGTPGDFGSGTSTIAANLQDMADNGTATFDRSTDSLQALRDHIADGTNLTEAGGTGDHLTAVATAAELTKVPKSDGTATWNATALASIQSEANDALVAYDPPTRAELTSDINSVLAKLNGLVLASGTIGATGNDTTHLHLTGLAYGDDGPNEHLLVFFDNSTSLYYGRWITDFATSGDLATITPALPVTPENSVDTYWITSLRRDVTATANVDLAAFFTSDSGETYASAVAGSVVKEIADNAGGSALTVEAIADAVWDEDATGHQTGGTFGQAIGDPAANTTTIYQSVVTDAAGTNIATDIIDIEGKVDDLESRLGTPSDLGSGATVAANLVDIESQTDDIGAAGAGLTVLATAAELAKVPKSDGTVTWNATALASINTQADLALSDVGVTTTVTGRIDAAITTRLAPTVAGRTLDVTATGAAGIDWGNVENPTTTVGLSGTTVGTVTTATTVTTLTGHTAQTGDSYAIVSSGTHGNAALKSLIDTADTVIDAVLAMLDNARSEPGQGTPPVNPDAMTKLDYLYAAWRNKKTQTATEFNLYADDGTTVAQKATVSDDGTTTTVGEMVTGP